MASLEHLRREADARRRAFFAAFTETKSQMRPAALAQEALASLDPHLGALTRLKMRALQNPFAVLAAAVGLFMLARQLAPKQPGPQPGHSKRARQSRLVRSTSIGDNHGHEHNSPQP